MQLRSFEQSNLVDWDNLVDCQGIQGQDEDNDDRHIDFIVMATSVYEAIILP